LVITGSHFSQPWYKSKQDVEIETELLVISATLHAQN